MSPTTVSCVIPAHNAARHIADALASVLEQTRAPDEVIVVDDGSTDDTPQVLARAGGHTRVIHQAQSGPGAARNTGVESASGEWIALLDADDWWLPDKTERMLFDAVQQPDVALVYSGRWIHDDTTGERRPAPLVCRSGRIYHGLLARNIVPTSSVLVRRDAWLDAGGMDASLVTCEDWDLWIRLARHRRAACVRERLCVYRVHEGGVSQGVGTSQPGVAQMRRDEHEVLQRALAADPDLPPRVGRRAWAAHHYRCGMDAYVAGDFKTARRLFRTALASAWHGGAARRYLETLLGRRIVTALRG